MRYKAEFTPSYLACPETGEWVPIEKCRRLLSRRKYARFSDECVTKKTTSLPVGDTKIRLQRTQALMYTLPRGSFKVKGNDIITTLKLVEGFIPQEKLKLARQWASLFNNTGTMCIVSQN